MRPGYKQTEVGVIPEDWEVKSLGSLTNLLTNGFVGTVTNVYTNADDGVLYIQGYNVEVNGYNLHGIKRVTKAFHNQHQKSCLQEGDLLTIQTGDIGVTTVVPKEFVGANCHALVISRLDKWTTESKFYCQYFNSEKGRIAFKEIETGTTMKHLNVGDMIKLPLPVPPLPEQRAIAAALSDVDALISGLDRLIAKKRDIKQAAMQQLLTGKLRLPGFSGEWEVKRLGECLLGRPDYGINAPAVPYSDRLPSYIRITDISEDGCYLPDPRVSVNDSNSENYYLHEGDLVFARTGASVGKSYLYNPSDGELVFAGFLIRVSPDNSKLISSFLAACVKTSTYWDWVRLMSMRSGQPGINGNEYAQLPLWLPPLPEQTAIATILSDMDAEIATLEARRDKSRAIKQGMMQELLTGKTRLNHDFLD